MLMDILMVNLIAQDVLEHNVVKIVDILFLIKKLMIQIQEDMMQEVLTIGKKILILEHIEILKLSML